MENEMRDFDGGYNGHIVPPVPGIVLAIWVTNLLSISFGKEVGFTLGLIFLSLIFYPILAFSNAEYFGPAGLKKVSLPPEPESQ